MARTAEEDGAIKPPMGMIEPGTRLGRPTGRMAQFFGEWLFSIVGAFVRDVVYSLWLKFATWLEPKIQGRTAKLIIGLLLGIGLFFLMPIVSGLLGL